MDMNGCEHQDLLGDLFGGSGATAAAPVANGDNAFLAGNLFGGAAPTAAPVANADDAFLAELTSAAPTRRNEMDQRLLQVQAAMEGCQRS